MAFHTGQMVCFSVAKLLQQRQNSVDVFGGKETRLCVYANVYMSVTEFTYPLPAGAVVGRAD